MKRLFSTVLTFLALAAMAYPFRTQIQIAAHVLFYVPCAQPITYTIGSFDNKFNVSKEYFLKAVDDAVNIWEKPLGKDLFVYKPTDGSLKLNLIFDYRALVTTKLAVIDTTLKINQSSYDSLKVKYNGMQAQYKQMNTDYDVRLAAFNKRRDEYEKQVAYWNSHKGVNQNTYTDLDNERKALQTEVKELQSLRDQINYMVTELNKVVVDLNSLAKSLNLNVDKYNEVDATRGETFEEGLYQTDGLSQKIDIYEFSDRNKLVRLLAHELGHSLGLEHVLDPKAIMYKINEGTDEFLTPDDLSAVKARCGIK